MRLKDISYGIKLPAALVAITLIVTATAALVQIKRFETAILERSNEISALATFERASKLKDYFRAISGATGSFAEYPAITNAARMLDTTYGLIEDPQSILQEAYIDNNPHPAGERQELVNSLTGLPYDRQHEAFHNYFTSFRDEHGLYDVFLINPDGEIIYSVFKEADYATNLRTGPYSDSGLARLFSKAISAEPGAVSFEDFDYYAPSAGAPAAFVGFPIIDNLGARLGVLAVQLPSSQLTALVNNPNGLGETGEVIAVGTDFKSRTASRFEDSFNIFDDMKLSDYFADVQDNELGFKSGIVGPHGKSATETYTTVSILGERWALVTVMDQVEIMAPVREARMIAGVIGGLSLAAMALAGFMISRSVTTPLRKVSADVARLSKKDFSISFDAAGQKDEMGILANALTDLKNEVAAGEDLRKTQQLQAKEQSEAIDVMSKALARLSDGDLSRPITENLGKDYARLKSDYNSAIERLNATLASLSEISQTIGERASNISASSETLSTDANMQAATLEESVASIDELAATARQNMETARTVQSLVLDAKADVDHNSGVVDETIKAMENLRKSSEEISAIIGLIEDISFQTNLLALNAGVEAARAGESGKGFAVVAAEVRALAQRSSDAASEIKSLVTESTRQVETGVRLVSETSGVISTVFAKVDQVNEQMKTVSEAVAEQSVTVGNLNSGMGQLDQVTQRNASMVDSFAAGSQTLEKQSQELAKSVAQFKLDGKAKSSLKSKTSNASANVSTLSSESTAIATLERQIEATHTPAAPKTMVEGNLAASDDSIWKDF